MHTDLYCISRSITRTTLPSFSQSVPHTLMAGRNRGPHPNINIHIHIYIYIYICKHVYIHAPIHIEEAYADLSFKPSGHFSLEACRIRRWRDARDAVAAQRVKNLLDQRLGAFHRRPDRQNLSKKNRILSSKAFPI